MDISSTSHTGAEGDLSRVSSKYPLQPGISNMKTSQTPDKKINTDNVTLSPEGRWLTQLPTSLEKNEGTSHKRSQKD